MNILKRYAKKILKIFMQDNLEAIPAIEQLAELQKKAGLFPLGHFYSPIPDWGEIQKDELKIWGNLPNVIDGIDLNEKEQLTLFDEFVEYYKELPFPIEKQDDFRYYFENTGYSYSDAITLYSMIRHAKPKHIIEVGSGHSSCLMLDTNERFLENTIKFTFIEPYPELLYSLIRESDKPGIQVFSKRLQDVDLQEFASLEKNDILFIDSTHVSKINSDVNYIFFKVLPSIKSGVYIHFHDIFYPFEYPKNWALEGRAWNEDYILRAFLEYNYAFKIVFFNTFLEYFHEDYFRERMALCLKNKGGSIWLQKQ